MNNSEYTLQNLEQAMDAMRRAVVGARERLGAGLQLSRTQLEILMILAQQGIRTTGELAHQLFLTQSAITQTVDTLVRRQLIERHDDEEDRRIVRLQLSPSGQEITSRVSAQKRESMKAMLATFSETEAQVLIAAIEKMTDFVETNQLEPKPTVNVNQQ